MPAIRIGDFDTWQPSYGAAVVTVYLAGTTTKASLYSDEALTVALANPQTLSSTSENGISYGKWAQAVYVGAAVYLDIDSTDQTGIVRPAITTLVGEDASDATVIATGGSVATNLEDIVARVIYATDYGALGATAATNNTTLTAAIGAANGNSGGEVIIPDGTYAFTSLTVSAGVVLRGQGRGVTTLQCQTGANCITLGGDKAGLASLTLDGVNNVASSVGVFAKGQDETVFDDVEVKRFVTGIQFKGGRRAKWRDFYIDSCGTGAKLHGDVNAAGGSDGDQFRGNEWSGGKVSLCTTTGVELSYEDRKCWHNTIRDVGFEDNTGTALRVNGAKWTSLPGCWWSGNTTNWAVLDDTDTTAGDDNKVRGLWIGPGSVDGGAASFRDTCDDVVLDRLEITNVDFTLTAGITNNLLVRDCVEDSQVTLAGDTTKWTRWKTIEDGEFYGTTSNATATKAWSLTLDAGERVSLYAHVIANSMNSDASGEYIRHISAKRAPATLAYDAQTANFTLGSTLTGGTSGATALIVGDSDVGATGTLSLRLIKKAYQNNETITDGSGGSALANGTLSVPTVSLLGSSLTDVRTREDVAGWDAAFAAASPDVEFRVTGTTAVTIEWSGKVWALRAP